MERVDGLYLVPEELHSGSELVIDGDDFDGVTFDAEVSPGKVNVVSLVLNRHELSNELVPINLLSNL